MVFDWLKGGQRTNYAKDIEQLQEQLKKKRDDPRVKLQLAEVLIQAKRSKEASGLLEAVADDFALQGFAARAIAVLKRLDKLEPGNSQVEEKLAYLISQQDNPAPSPWRAKAAERSHAAFEIGMEEISDAGFELGMEAAGSAELPLPVPPPVVPVLEARIEPPVLRSAPVEPVTAAPRSARNDPSTKEFPAAKDDRPPLDLADDALRHEFLALVDLAFTPDDAPAPAVSSSLVASPLFSDFRPDELIALIRGLELHTFEPGEIIVSQGEPGESLFILTGGTARAYVRDAAGRNRQVREMREGDLFGEIAVMSGMPRTATITAAARCEMLELDRPALNTIAAAHPRVREVLQEFYARHSER
jgi:cAMP-dependent protein kinase regulator